MPVGAFGGSEELMDLMDNSDGAPVLAPSGTFSGNNFTLAAGLATMRALTDEVYEHLDSLGNRLGMKLGPVFDDAGSSQPSPRGRLGRQRLPDRQTRPRLSELQNPRRRAVRAHQPRRSPQRLLARAPSHGHDALIADDERAHRWSGRSARRGPRRGGLTL